VLFSTTILLVASFVAFLALVFTMRILRRTRKPEAPMNVDFSIADLHEMLRRRQISPEEFERAKAVVLKRVTPVEPRPGHGFQVIQEPPTGNVEGDVDRAGDGSGSRDAR
jgi:hypothetical protein